LDVELVMFNTAADKDIALVSGAIDGYFGDLFTPVVIEANGNDISIVASNYNTQFDRRMFGVLSRPNSDVKSCDQLKNVQVAISSNSIIEYLTESLLKQNGLDTTEIDYVEVKNIGLRMQMLMSGQIDAATLPEPLVSAAVAAEATRLADDQELVTSQTVLIFRKVFLTANPTNVTNFLTAVSEANEYINKHPDDVRPIMTTNIRLPEPLKDKYPVPKFPELKIPDSLSIKLAIDWLDEKNILNNKPIYDELIDGSFIK